MARTFIASDGMVWSAEVDCLSFGTGVRLASQCFLEATLEKVHFESFDDRRADATIGRGEFARLSDEGLRGHLADALDKRSAL
jgi:hypothetical protein